LPPHFDLSAGEVLTLAEWEQILPGYRSFYPQRFRQVLVFLLASLVHHKSWLKDRLSSNHPLFQSRLWSSDILDRLSSKAYIGVGKHPTTGLIATGVPPHIRLANQIEILRTEGKLFQVELVDLIRSNQKS